MVKFPIGGKVRERESARPGETPGPTVTVWMEEDVSDIRALCAPLRTLE